jgi:hypothetical protein
VTPPLTPVSEAACVLWKLAYLTRCCSIQLLALLLLTCGDTTKDLEILVLRHLWVPETSSPRLTCVFASVVQARDDPRP